MKKTWNIGVWGVRGSFPVADKRFLDYGGNTSCIMAEYGEELVILDAGSGLAHLGDSLFLKGKKRADILLSHLHLDHVMGLLRFNMLYDKDAQIHLYGGMEEKGGLLKQLETLLGPPYWPLKLSDCPAHIEVHEICPGEDFFLAGQKEGKDGIRICTLSGNHPGKSLLYRLEAEDSSIVYALDCETDEKMFSSLSEFSRGCDLIIWDGNFTKEDLERHRGWGHSSWKQGIALCQAAGIKRMLVTHYSSDYSDDFLKSEESRAKRLGAACDFAKEGMVIQV